jgi:hypothetical protein
MADVGPICYSGIRLPEGEMVAVPTMKVDPMARSKGRPEKPGGEGVVVRIAADLVSKAKYLAAQKGVPMSDYLSDLLRPVLDREFRKAGKELLKGDE